MTISMKVLWRLKVETFSFEASAVVSGERDCLLSLSLVSLADGGRAVSLLSSVALEAEADAAAVSEAEEAKLDAIVKPEYLKQNMN